MVGVYQHCSEQHLQRYLTEFDFRYSNRIKLGVDDAMRTERAIKGAPGKRWTYRRPGDRQARVAKASNGEPENDAGSVSGDAAQDQARKWLNGGRMNARLLKRLLDGLDEADIVD